MAVSDAAFEAVKRDVNSLRTEHAVRTERDQHIEERLTKIEVILSRLTWIIVSGIGGAFVAFVINGGLSTVVGAMPH